ncbi:hypothetical protein Tcan_07844 [Toxocara canis]|uniref:Uncharacterized protein n=1 Tax=Toxocara canis TaxID=6265 RepID=A0A0B2W1U4_TOXCA|nr:hypothetical protein Tcan_07844 [Toxocara canis]
MASVVEWSYRTGRQPQREMLPQPQEPVLSRRSPRPPRQRRERSGDLKALDAASSLRASLSPQSANGFRSQDTSPWPSSEDGSEQPLLSTISSCKDAAFNQTFSFKYGVSNTLRTSKEGMQRSGTSTLWTCGNIASNTIAAHGTIELLAANIWLAHFFG